jgi:hypothetical protein
MKIEFDDNLEKWMGLFIGSVLFTIVGLLVSYLAGQVSTLECSKTDGKPNCQLRTTFMNKYPLKTIPIRDLQSAYVEESCDDNCTYRVILVTGVGQQALTSGADSDQSGKNNLAKKVNDFLAGPNPAGLKISDGGGWWLALTGGFVLVGVGMGIYLVFLVIKSLVQSSKTAY